MRHRIGDKKTDVLTVALAGNPNVGKSTLFNALTGLHQHTGNWTGKTVDCAEGYFEHGGKRFRLIDLPGAYSISACSDEERVACEFLKAEEADAICVVCDALSLERQLILVLQLMRLSRSPLLVVLNFERAARRRGILIDTERLSLSLGVPVVTLEATEKRVRVHFGEALQGVLAGGREDQTPLLSPSDQGYTAEQIAALAQRVAIECTDTVAGAVDTRDRLLDRVLTGRLTGFPVMLALLALLLWITMVGANGLSDILMSFFSWAEVALSRGAKAISLPWWVSEPLILGVLRTVGWVVAVMLPPMAIFFPLFTLLEDLGYLPRMAFNLDRAFGWAHGSGKQALTMCMGLGCNAVGVMGCRIIDSPRERKIAMLTNSLMPCNGRFPTLIALIGLFVAVSAGVGGALAMAGVLVWCVVMTLVVTRVLSATVLRGKASSFILELPPYRVPRVGEVLVRSVLDRTLRILGRAVFVSAPAGLLLWLLGNCSVGEQRLLAWLSSFLDGVGRVLGMDGAILLAFVFSLVANELFLPVLVMIYNGGGAPEVIESMEGLRALLVGQGWTTTTAICVMLFVMFHWPCATTIWTLRCEGEGTRWAVLGCLVPTLLGAFLCTLVSAISSLIT